MRLPENEQGGSPVPLLVTRVIELLYEMRLEDRRRLRQRCLQLLSREKNAFVLVASGDPAHEVQIGSGQPGAKELLHSD